MNTTHSHAGSTSGRIPAAWKTVLAFAIIYFVWGSTYLCIRIGVQEMPPFLMAALRFVIAGAALFAWMLFKDKKWPSWHEWVGASILGALMFLIDYSCLFWAEQRVPSGIAAVVLATIPIFITLLEIVILRTVKLTVALAFGLLLGILGVVELVNPASALSGTPLERGGAIALLISSLSWSVGTILTKRLTLPASKGMSSALQMLTGGIQLTILAFVAGEAHRFHPAQISLAAWLALLYLIVAGSLIAFTAYVWLLHYQTPTRVGTYAYVNPVVAIILGYFFAGEVIKPNTIVGTLLVLVSVATISWIGKSRPMKSAES